MVENARLAAEQSDVARKPTFVVSPAESLGFLENGSVDMAIAGMLCTPLLMDWLDTKKRSRFWTAQAVHWFNYESFFPELARVLKPGGTVALWNYNELRVGGRPSLDPLITRYSQSEKSLGPYWEQPGE